MNAIIEKTADDLFKKLHHLACEPERKWSYEKCLEVSPLILEINELKREKDAIILAHSYTYPEIIYGVADFKSDSYALCLEAKKINSKKIVFAGVKFMAETAKILCPQAEVYLPDSRSGCSLATSLSASELIALKQKYPGVPVVCYINSSTEVKALSDVVVTSANVFSIVAGLPTSQVIFVPDQLMGKNIQRELLEKGIFKQIIVTDGTCEVHDQFTAEMVTRARSLNPHLKIVAHPECLPEVTPLCDFVGSTGKMMDYVRDRLIANQVEETPQDEFMMLTECGLVGRIEVEYPEARFVSSCKLCPHMKLNSLEKIKQVLTAPRPDQIIEVEEELRLQAKRAIDQMFALTK